MGFRYRKSVKLPFGFRVNFSRKGIGYSWGVKGYRKTVTADGKLRTTYSIPGTGVSYVEEEKLRRNSENNIRSQSDVDLYTNNHREDLERFRPKKKFQKRNIVILIFIGIFIMICLFPIIKNDSSDMNNTYQSQHVTESSQEVELFDVEIDNDDIISSNSAELSPVKDNKIDGSVHAYMLTENQKDQIKDILSNISSDGLTTSYDKLNAIKEEIYASI